MKIRLYFKDRVLDFHGDELECSIQIMNARQFPTFITYDVMPQRKGD